MADTQKTRAEILTIMADNTTGQISPQDQRDMVVTIMEEEFANPGDFWKQPDPANMTTDKTIKGWIDYSQLAGEDLSFGNVLYLHASNVWKKAMVSDSTENPAMGVAGNSYTSNDSQCQILRRGLVYDSGLSARFSGFIGRPIYLMSHGSYGSISVTITTNSVAVVGVIEADTIGSGITSSKWRFDPDGWAIKGS